VPTSLPDPASRTGAFFIRLCNSTFFTRSKRADEASGTLSSHAIQSQAKPLPAATGVYSFSLFQVLTLLNFLLNFIRFSSVFRKIPDCSVRGGVCAPPVVHEQGHFPPFPLKTAHCNIVFFSLEGCEKARHAYSFPLQSYGQQKYTIFHFFTYPQFYSNTFYLESGVHFDIYY